MQNAPYAMNLDVAGSSSSVKYFIKCIKIILDGCWSKEKEIISRVPENSRSKPSHQHNIL